MSDTKRYHKAALSRKHSAQNEIKLQQKYCLGNVRNKTVLSGANAVGVGSLGEGFAGGGQLTPSLTQNFIFLGNFG